jgi:hypothetical protein
VYDVLSVSTQVFDIYRITIQYKELVRPHGNEGEILQEIYLTRIKAPRYYLFKSIRGKKAHLAFYSVLNRFNSDKKRQKNDKNRRNTGKISQKSIAKVRILAGEFSINELTSFKS